MSTKKQPAFGRIVDLPGDHIVALTTTHNVEGKQIVEYHNLVTGEAIVGANIFRDFFAGIQDIVGGRSATYEKKLAKARAIVTDELSESARQMGGNAIVGIDIDYEVIGKGGSMLMVSISGTAATIV